MYKVCYKLPISIQFCRLLGWLEFAGVENDGPSKNGVEFAGLENDGLENDGLENDWLEQEQTHVLHTLKTFNVYDM